MRVHIATDHAGMELSSHLITALSASGYEMVDHGPAAYDAEDDYPSFCINAAAAVVADQAEGVDALGIVLGGSGNGEQIAANKVKGVRAALAWNLDTAKLAREHNNANVLTLGGTLLGTRLALEVVQAFMRTPFAGGRHEPRVAKIDALDAPRRATTS